MNRSLFYLFTGIFAVGMATAGISQTSEEDFKARYNKAVQLYKKGDIDASQKALFEMLENQESADTNRLTALNNFLGINSFEFGEYDDALKYYFLSLSFIDKSDNSDIKKQTKILNNIGNTYKKLWKYRRAVEYFERAMVVIEKSNIKPSEKFSELQYIYYNLAIVYYHIKDYSKAVEYYNESLSIKNTYKLKGIDKVYFNLARSYVELNQFKKAEYYFIQAVKLREELYGKDYHRLAPLYMFYGDFLRKQGNYHNAYNYLNKAKTVYEHTYGKRHPYTANSCVYLGDYYTAISKHDSALFWYQQSLIANSKHFKSKDIYKNPESDNCFSGLQLLSGLKRKAKAILNIANTKSGNEQNEFYALSLKTTDIALNLITTLRKDYISLDSKLIITEDEKECYSTAVKASTDLYKKIKYPALAEKAFMYASISKASCMNSNLEYERELNAVVPVSVRNEKTKTEKKISGLKKLIFEENEKLKPDSSKINLWKTQLFKLNNDYDTFIEELKAKYQISTNPDKHILSLKEIKNKLPEQTTLVEYFISKDNDSKKQYLYTFVINSEGFWHFTKELSYSFLQNIEIIKYRMNHFNQASSGINSFNHYNKASYELYLELTEPVKHLFNGQNIIIVPDEEIACISFEALLSEFKEYSNINYADLPYLIFDYCFSYAYSTPLLMNNKQNNYTDFVYAFAPNYNTNSKLSKSQSGNLSQTKNEIESVLKQFNGKALLGNTAVEDSFKSISKAGGILHLAMHAFTEEDQNEFSFLAFSKNQNSQLNEDGLLYAYEIDAMKINSPLVVLSACNTGKGKLFSGEGIFSLSRSFLKAGVPAVIHCLWSVNDDAGSTIMKYFYQNSAKGMTKNNALRSAKLKYMEESCPAMVNPFYWSGYVLTGDVSPIKKTIKSKYFFYGFVILFLFLVLIGFWRRNKAKN